MYAQYFTQEKNMDREVEVGESVFQLVHSTFYKKEDGRMTKALQRRASMLMFRLTCKLLVVQTG